MNALHRLVALLPLALALVVSPAAHAQGDPFLTAPVRDDPYAGAPVRADQPWAPLVGQELTFCNLRGTRFQARVQQAVPSSMRTPDDPAGHRVLLLVVVTNVGNRTDHTFLATDLTEAGGDRLHMEPSRRTDNMTFRSGLVAVRDIHPAESAMVIWPFHVGYSARDLQLVARHSC